VSDVQKLPIRAGLAALLALFVGGALGLSCGTGSSPETTTKAPTSQQEQSHPKRPPRVPSKGGTTTIEPAP
jgi:hypothetical protein